MPDQPAGLTTNLESKPILAGAQPASKITPSELSVHNAKALGFKPEQWGNLKIEAIKDFAHLLHHDGLTHKVLMHRTFSSLEQITECEAMISEILADKTAPREHKIAAGELLVHVMREKREMIETASRISEKTGERAVIEATKLNKPPTMVQVNVTSNGPAQVTEKKVLAEPAK